jgi:hypothetical protein
MPVNKAPPQIRVFTVVPDVNVLVSAHNANRAGRTATISQRVLGHLTAGHVNGVPVQVAVSFKMIDTFRGVLQRKGVDPAAVDAVAQALVSIMRYGPRRLDPYVVFGGTPDPSLLDVEDGGVLATAFAARADLLITDNLTDFAAPDCETWKTSVAMKPDGTRRQLSCQIHTRPDGQTLMVVHPGDFVHWIERRFEISPRSLRATFGPGALEPKKSC